MHVKKRMTKIISQYYSNGTVINTGRVVSEKSGIQLCSSGLTWSELPANRVLKVSFPFDSGFRSQKSPLKTLLRSQLNIRGIIHLNICIGLIQNYPR